MYKIDKVNNNISKIKEESFSNLKYRERDNLQERIAKNPDIFGEELLIIQKEFDGFNDTRERLDLLALDKEGNIIIIENKLDDTGCDVVRQSLKYASYCSTLTRKEIIDIFQSYLDKNSIGKNAKEELERFYEIEDIDEIELNALQSQRIMMVAGNFRKEVTSTALRLMSYGLKVQCFKATIFAENNDHFLNIEQIIPIQDAEEFTIKVAEKQKEIVQTQVSQTRKGKLHKEFWIKLLERSNKIFSLYENINPTNNHWLSAGSGLTGAPYSYVTTKRYCRVELYPGLKDLEENKEVFNYLYKHKLEIEQTFGNKLERDDGGNKKYTRIGYSLSGVNIENEDDQEKIINFLTINMKKLYETMDPYLKKFK